MDLKLSELATVKMECDNCGKQMFQFVNKPTMSCPDCEHNEWIGVDE